MVEIVVCHKDLRVAEVVAGIAEVWSIESPEFIFGPGLEIRRCGTHDDLTVLAIAVVSSVIDVIGTVFLIGATSTNGCILLVVVTGEG